MADSVGPADGGANPLTEIINRRVENNITEAACVAIEIERRHVMVTAISWSVSA
jgi:hypothetical protein